MHVYKTLRPAATLGSGPDYALERGMELRPDVVAIVAGSMRDRDAHGGQGNTPLLEPALA